MTDDPQHPAGLPDYVVIRPGPNLPPNALPAHLDGTWFNLPTMATADTSDAPGQWTPVPTGRFETRGDGAVAEVWEVRSPGRLPERARACGHCCWAGVIAYPLACAWHGEA